VQGVETHENVAYSRFCRIYCCSNTISRNLKIIESVVGKKVYEVWLDMLSRMVPHGRTHRLSVLIASMLQYTQEIAYANSKTNTSADELSVIFESAFDSYVEDDTKLILQITESIFEDAKVKYKRVNSRGHGYSIAEEAVHNFLHWEDMPRES
jgi:hypothetical protein